MVYFNFPEKMTSGNWEENHENGILNWSKYCKKLLGFDVNENQIKILNENNHLYDFSLTSESTEKPIKIKDTVSLIIDGH